MSQRTDRVASELRQVIGDALPDIKDPRVREAGMVTVTQVRVSGDLRQARVLFIVHGADESALERVRLGFDSASGFLRRRVGERLRLKVTPALSFAADRGFDAEARIEALLRDEASKE